MATPAPLPASVPAPLLNKTSQDDKKNDVIIPIAPSLKLNLVCDEVFLGGGTSLTHGKLWVRAQCVKKGMKRSSNGKVPSKETAFCFVPNFYAYSRSTYDRFKMKSPCIGNIANNFVICDKGYIVETLYKYYGEYTFKHIIPLSFVIDYDYINHKFKLSDNKQLCECIKNTNTKIYESWIVKSSVGHGGINVFIWTGNNLNDLQNFLLIKQDPYKWLDLIHAQYHKIRLVISKYINNPLLYKNKYKFDTRIYVMIAKTNPIIAYYAGMKCRLSTKEYDVKSINDQDDDNNRLGHITNTYQQVIQINDVENKKQDISLDWQQFLQFMYNVAVKQRKFNDEWFDDDDDDMKIDDMEFEQFVTIFENKIKKLCGLTIDAACQDWDNYAIDLDRIGQFCFLGVDVLIDDNGKLWLIELNACPSIKGGGNNTMQSTLKNLLFEMVDIVHEIREKRLNGINVTKHNDIDSEVKYWQPINIKHYDTHNTKLFHT